MTQGKAIYATSFCCSPWVGQMQALLESPFLSALGEGMGNVSISLPAWPVPAVAAVGLLSKPLEISSETQLLLAEATCLSHIRPASFPWEVL